MGTSSAVAVQPVEASLVPPDSLELLLHVALHLPHLLLVRLLFGLQLLLEFLLLLFYKHSLEIGQILIEH